MNMKGGCDRDGIGLGRKDLIREGGHAVARVCPRWRVVSIDAVYYPIQGEEQLVEGFSLFSYSFPEDPNSQ